MRLAGTEWPERCLKGIMPGCRKSLPYSMARPRLRGVSAGQYVVHGRMPMRASNDNRRSQNAPGWYWALAVGVLPTMCVALLLSVFL
ncbi:hypothetical protein PMNALOAF_2229 [Methylobacterium adhaesivum]|nr:hypothetical protein PMNALOAF_2229 [Methylobacterium adhaesivum]